MPIQLLSRNVVVTARQFNPAIFADIWLADHNIVTRDELAAGSERLQMPMLSKVTTPSFELTVLPDRLQVTIDEGVANPGQLFQDRIGAVVRTLPHTPFVGVGINSQWRITPHGGDIVVFAREKFFHAGTAFARAIDCEGAQYGFGVSRPACGGTLKLRIGAEQIANGDDAASMAADFNYDYRVRGNPVEDVIAALQRWEETVQDTARILESLEADDGN